MNFEYDFKDGHTRFSYRSKPGEVLDEKTWSILTQGTANQFLLPANANQDGNGFIFTYDIAGTMNIMAWMSEAPQEKQIEIQQKVNYVLTFFEELGVPKQEIVSEMQNIYVDTRTEEVKVVCIPLRSESGGFGGGADGFSHEQTGQTANYDEGGPLVPPTPGGGFVDMDGDVEEKKPKKKKALLKGLFHRMEKKQEVQEEIPFPQEMPPMPPEMPPQRPENIWANTPNEGGWDNPPEENRKTYPSPGEGFGEDPGRGYEPDPASGFGETPGRGYEPDPAPGFGETPGRGYEPDPAPGFGEDPGRGYEPDPAPGFGETPGRGYEPDPASGFGETPGRGYEPDPAPGFGEAPGRGYEPDPASGFGEDPGRGYEPDPASGFGEDPGRGYEPDPAPGFGEDPAGGYEPDPTPGFWDKPAGGYNPDPMPGNDGAQGRGYTPNPTSGFGEEQRKSFTPNPGTGFASDDDDGNDATVMLRDDGSEATILLKARVKPNATLIRLHTQEKFHITTEICKIGKRALMVDICIRNNPTISREHCAIHFEEGKYYLEDKDSSNYTYLNGNRAMPGQKLLLNDGDQIRLSDEEFIFRKGDVK